MSLTKEDLSQVRDVVVEAIQELILPRFDEHDKRLTAIEQDVRGLKEDVRVLKDDVRVLKDDVRVLKEQMREVGVSIGRIEGRLEAVEADIKELYDLLDTQKPSYADKQFAKLSVERKVLNMYEDVKLLAQEAGVALPN